ncbi:MAG: methylamine methyltransferase corrinoid protein reductive activase [Methanolobus sp.]|uniref:methylamine methyltransferase corrinoid protein reductive activase n=1 Tax=Methanolobus sp. TaxID=1874737 RepID=UPI0027304EB1|nr:methylamine methyltransferase corrinoid protein reductive activase [Methanolobus sp.]MDP2218124.1 methylamine methyltransferase corrinoid protein reductive activase [Methanolobus sp.]
MYGIAIDLGTSGFRLQLIDLESRSILKTIMTMKHPLPGGNVIDHLGFAIQVGGDVANKIMVHTLQKMFDMLPVSPEEIRKIAVCGNPIQLSLFQNIEIRDLAYAGKNMQQRLGIGEVKRGMKIYDGIEIFGKSSGLDVCDLIVLPSIEHEIGADALAMMVKTDFMKQDGISLVTDYGTNAEMALKVNGRIITCSAAAGPAIEGQGIKCGMLASPGAISDVNEENGMWRITVLDERMDSRKSHLIDPLTGVIFENGELSPLGITGTGVISAISLAMSMGLIKTLPHLPNGKLILGEGVELSDKDIEEAGKAIGAIRAAHLTLLVEAGLKFEDLEYMYMSGASGTYVDADKARKIGLAPRFVKKIVQFGNTSLELAKDVVLGNYELQEIQELADRIKADHIMLASNETFKNIYACELAYWTEGMPEEVYDSVLESYNMPRMPSLEIAPLLQRRVKKDISSSESGGIEIMQEMDTVIEEQSFGCMGCKICERECPESAIKITSKNGSVYAGYMAHLCLGMSCKRCIRICPAKAIHYRDIRPVSSQDLSVI